MGSAKMKISTVCFYLCLISSVCMWHAVAHECGRKVISLPGFDGPLPFPMETG